MGQQVQESQIATYERRKQREGPADRLRTLFDQNDELREEFTVTTNGEVPITPGEKLFAMIRSGVGERGFVVMNQDGRVVGGIGGESGRVLAGKLESNGITTVGMTVLRVVPVSGDAKVQLQAE
jgi:hypothetical protein